MSSPRGSLSPFEYRPTVQLGCLVLFVVLPLIYLMGRVSLKGMSLVGAVLSWPFRGEEEEDGEDGKVD